MIYLQSVVDIATHIVVTTSALNWFTQCIYRADLLVLRAFVYLQQNSGPNSASLWLLSSLKDKLSFGITPETISPFSGSRASFRHSKKRSSLQTK